MAMAKPPLTKQTLKNGMPVIVRESHDAPVASFWIYYRVGSRNESSGHTGISHWVEHMLFKGTERFPRLFRLIGTLGKPTICAANGHVLAGALGIALACDLIVASEQATFGTPEINVGAFPFMIMALIYRNVSRKKTNELLLLGDRIDAREAERIGIVNRVVPAEEFDAAVAEWASKLASKSPLIMRLGKDAMYRQLDMPFEDALDYLRAQLSLAMSTEDIVEGVQAFFEKREPKWKGR